MLSTIIRALLPSANSDSGSSPFPDFGGRWTNIVGGYGRSYSTSSGETINEQASFAIAAWFACIRNISEDIAKLPLGVYMRADASRESQYEHPVAEALRKPNDIMTAFAFRETLIQHALGFGDGYAEITISPNGIIKLYPLDPTRMLMKSNGARLQYRYSDPYTLTTVDFDSNQLIHIHGLGYDGCKGYSFAAMFRELLGIAIANMKVTGSLWNNGLFIGGVLQHPAGLSDDALKHLRESFEARHGGSRNAGKLMILEEGMTFNQLAIDPQKAQLIEQRQFDVEEVARVFRMPLHKIGHLLRSTFNNIEHQAREYVIDCLMPWIVRCEQEFDRKLFSDTEQDLYTKHNVMGLLRGDEAARSDYYMKMIQVGMTPNQILALEEMPSIGSEGDIPYIAQNIRPMTEEARQAQVESLKTPARNQQEPIKSNPANMPTDRGGRPRNSTAKAYVEAIETVLEPLVRMEVNAISKAAQKWFDNRPKFFDAITKFNIEHAERLRVALEPALGALVVILEGERNDPRIDVQVRAYIASLQESKRAIIDTADFPIGIERAIESWPTRELNKMANDLADMALALSEPTTGACDA